MLGAVAGLASREGVRVADADAVTVSFPGFFDVVAALRDRQPSSSRTEPERATDERRLAAARKPSSRLRRDDRCDRRARRCGEEHGRPRRRGAARVPLPRHRGDVPRPHLARAARGRPLDDGPALAALAHERPVVFGEGQTVWIADEDVTTRIRQPEIDASVPVVARHPEVREVMRERQRELGRRSDAVIEGRDIGVVVVPEAELKVWLTADPEVRVAPPPRRARGDRRGAARRRPAPPRRA